MTSTTHYVRTENGAPTLVTAEEGLAEGRAAYLDRIGAREFVMVFAPAKKGCFDITYKDERRITLRPARKADLRSLSRAA